MMNDLSLMNSYEINENALLLDDAGNVPLIYWPITANFGDELSRWLFEKLTHRKVIMSDGSTPAYVAIGSILNRVKNTSIVWGTGSFGTEPRREINKNAVYHAVRGPLTRSKILSRGGKCPRIYGDPALLTPLFAPNPGMKEYEIGIAVRWSDDDWKELPVGEGVRLINFGSDNVEEVLNKLLSCKKIITSSLHGLIIADAYGIPSAWLSSTSPKGREYKFYDYFLSVEKVRHAHEVKLQDSSLTVAALLQIFDFDARHITFDAKALLDACPFLTRL